MLEMIRSREIIRRVSVPNAMHFKMTQRYSSRWFRCRNVISRHRKFFVAPAIARTSKRGERYIISQRIMDVCVNY